MKWRALVTEVRNCRERVRTVSGTVRHRQWCEAEATRLRRHGVRGVRVDVIGAAGAERCGVSCDVEV